MSATPVELRVAGQTYRVIASADETDLQRLARMVDERAHGLTAPGRQVSAQSVLLAALALAHDLEEERCERKRVEERSREMLKSVLSRIDAALESADQLGEGEAQLGAPASPDGARP